MTTEPSGPELAAELEQLRVRLADAEEALHAIRNGDVDAVVVAGRRGEQVFTLRGADRIYRQLIETMSEGAATLSADGVILYCNTRLAVMLERTLDRVLGTALRDYLPPADQQAFDATLAQARTETCRREINLATSKGRLAPVYLSASRLQSEGAELVFCLVLTDLTEQKSHERIVAAERLARSILEQAADAIVVCDEQGRIIRFSQAAREFCDGSPLLRPFAEAIPLRTDAADPFHLAPVLQGETLRNVDVALDRQGQKFDLLLNASPLLSGRQVLGCVVTLTDITERKRMEEDLKFRNVLLSTQQEASLDGILVVDEEAKILLYNRRFIELWGLPAKLVEDRADEPVLQFVSAQIADIPSFLQRVQDLYEHRQETSQDELILADGRVFDRYSAPMFGSDERYYGRVWYFRDITERKRAEEAILDSEKRFRSLAEATSQIIWFTDGHGRVCGPLPSWQAYTGQTDEEIRGTGWSRALHPDDLARTTAIWTNAIAGKTGYETEYRLRRHDGDYRHFAVRGAPVVAGDGSIREWVGTCSDITERKWAEEEREKTLRWRLGVNQLHQSLLASAPLEDKLRSLTDEIVRLFNADFCRVWLIRPGDLCERGCVHAGVREGPHVCRYRDRCLHLLASSGRYTHIDGKVHRRVPFGAYKIGRVAAGEDHKFLTNDVLNDPLVHDCEWARELGLVSFAGYQLRIYGGETMGVLVLFAKHPILPAEDALLDGLSSVLAEVVQQAQTEESLRASEAKYRGLFESSRDAITIFEPSSWTITAANPAAATMFGAKNEEEFVSHGLEELSPEQQPDGHASAEKFREMIETALREGSHFFEWTHRRIGGAEFPADVILTRMEQGGRVVLQATVRNITESKRREAVLAQAKEAAEAANRAKDEFLANMSHELRTPLTAILGFSELLMRPDLPGQEQRQFLKFIQSKGADLLRVLNDLLDLSRIKAGQLTVHKTDCPLQQILDDVLATVQVQAAEKGLRLQLVCTLPLPERIRTDSVRLRQILANLLGNAVKFTAQGEVCLTVRYRAEGDPPERMQFAISDTGIGIPTAKLGELFQPFMQVDGSLTRRYGGTGLGLAISQQLAQRLDGEIQVSSEVGRGSTFTLTVAVGPLPEPAAAQQDRAERTGEPSPAPALHGRVLFVEDEPVIQLVVRHMASRLHVEVDVAGDGHLACELAEQSQAESRPYELILMDIQLPRMDGYEATRWLRHHGWQGPIVALTAHAMQGDREKCLAAGCDAYLSKPISQTELEEILTRYLGALNRAAARDPTAGSRAAGTALGGFA